ncbi:MAG: glucose 1-dehydrogenase [Parvibaculum sp.]|jgi:NAD(P)-dependent dehydrogenase (short-subunit alcohol dehydrogenase family)|uniref:glucose 1-dehydrogenase n=1 Tax=Parvibaculum sp. TaxID=2024848 RepID=UPI0025D1A13E|nr:glucose 1-dehydrogenase [Parvibaculum sp.]MCE9649224.1 glucose 1-dehydrogenase [Parvibaculum sp.]
MTDTADISLPSFDLTGKVALVTGATSGLGRRFALILAKSGASVAITGRRVDRLETLKAEITSLGGKALAVALDVTDPASIKACVEAAEQGLGPINILVNNAGMNVQAMAHEVTPEGYDTMFDTNVRGAFFMAQAVGNRMIARGEGGRIINIASIGAFTQLPGLTIYTMTKAAVAMMTKSLAKEWARKNINVNAMCPGFIETELNSEWFQSEGGQRQIKTFPRRRLGQESDLDGTLLLLASDHSRFITGSLFTADDGQSL